MKSSKTKNPYFFEEEENPDLWIIDKRARWLVYLIIVLATTLVIANSYKQIKLQSERKFPKVHEVKTK